MEILQRYSESDRFAELFWDQAKFIPTTKAESTVYDPSIQTLWNELIKRVISLPDRVLNSYKLTPESILWPKNFFAMIGKVIIKVLKSVHDAISGNFISKNSFIINQSLPFMVLFLSLCFVP